MSFLNKTLALHAILIAQVLWAAPQVSVPSLPASMLVQKMDRAKKGIVESERLKREVLGLLYDINKRMKQISNDKSQLTSEMLVMRSNVKNFSQLIVRLEDQIGIQKRKILGRFRAIGKLGRLGYAKVLLSEMSLGQMERNGRFLNLLAQRDVELLKNYRNNLQSLKLKQNELRKEVAKLLVVERQVLEQEKLILSEHNRKKKILSKLEDQVSENWRKIAKVRDIGKDLLSGEGMSGNGGALSGHQFGPFFFERKGRLAHPIEAPIVQDYGLITESNNVRLLHKGISYRQQGEKSVFSVFLGRVAFVGELKGYGRTVILDHGDSYYTVYAHLGTAKVVQGDEVLSGQEIGSAGTGDSSQEGLYFEIRHFSAAEDPNDWLSSKQVKVSSLEASLIDDGTD